MSERSKALVPEFVRQKALNLGEEGEAWLAELPAVIAHLEARWSLTAGETLAGGTAAFVARAKTASGGEAVLKIALPDPLFHAQAQVLERARGRGYARLLEVDLDRHAILLEALGPSLEQLGMPAERQLEILSAMLKRAWEVPPWQEPTQAAAEAKARTLHALVSRLWEELGRPCAEKVLTQALRYAGRRMAAAEPGSHTGVEAQAIWEWGFLERVSSGLYALSFGAEELGRPFLATAELLVD